MLITPAYAKLNLALEVVRRRPDGWHDISSVVSTIDWHDVVGIALTILGDKGSTEVSLQCNDPDIPAGDENVAVQAAQKLGELAGRSLQIQVWLHKRVPVAAGLGGGSADAAAVLRAGSGILKDMGCEVSQPALMRAASQTGSDVPALLVGGTTLVAGTGDVVEPIVHAVKRVGDRRHPGLAPSLPNVRSARVSAIPRNADLHMAVAIAGRSSTQQVYAAWDDDPVGADGRVEHVAAHLRNGNTIPDELCGSALEKAACNQSPSLANALTQLRERVGQAVWHLTGSGGGAFALAATRAEAEALTEAARAMGLPARACRTASVQCRP